MDIVTTSLEALLQRATNPQNENVDKAAVEAFCALVNKENEGAHIAIRLIATRIHATNEKEALQTLGILDACMKKCGSSFNSEVGKFRFLNEMIKLVSPKYLGSQTPPIVRVKVLQLLQSWTEDYPKESKIKEAYDMLKKQGVVVENSASQKTECLSIKAGKSTNSIFDNDERSRLLQKLLQSKNPDDLQAANRLIKTMVKEDDKRAELVSRRIVELESVHNNVRLLNEMLDSYRPGQSSSDEVELIEELHESCERLKPNVAKLAADTQLTEEMLKEVLQASDELSKVSEKFIAIIKNKIFPYKKQSEEDSLLDLGTSHNAHSTSLLLDSDNLASNMLHTSMDSHKPQSDIDALCDIFSSNALPVPMSLLDSTTLKPTTLQQPTLQATTVTTSEPEKTNSKLKALEDLDALGESLLKENLSGTSSRSISSFNKATEKIPMNLLPKQSFLESQIEPKPQSTLSSGDSIAGLDLSFLTGELTKKTQQSKTNSLNGDDNMVDISDESADTQLCLNSDKEILTSENNNTPNLTKPDEIKVSKSDIKPMNDICVKLESVKPSSVPPLTVLEEKNGISVILHFAKDRPREDVQVIVVTTISKNSLPLSSYLFQAVVPKTCKLKLQPPSGNELPAHNPFLPPSAITQIMLIANPAQQPISLKFMISYTMDDETCTEMGEVDSLSVV